MWCKHITMGIITCFYDCSILLNQTGLSEFHSPWGLVWFSLLKLFRETVISINFGFLKQRRLLLGVEWDFSTHSKRHWYMSMPDQFSGSLCRTAFLRNLHLGQQIGLKKLYSCCSGTVEKLDKTNPQLLAVCSLKYGACWCVACRSLEVAIHSWKCPYGSGALGEVLISHVQEAVSFLSAFCSAELKANLQARFTLLANMHSRKKNIL